MLFKNVSYTKNAESGHAVPIQTKISNKWSKQNEPSEEEATEVEVSGCLIKKETNDAAQLWVVSDECIREADNDLGFYQ